MALISPVYAGALALFACSRHGTPDRPAIKGPNNGLYQHPADADNGRLVVVVRAPVAGQHP